MNIDDLAAALRTIAEENWQKFQQPIFLSVLPKRLVDRLQADYKQVLGEQSLKSYIQASGSEKGYRLVEHPTQRAKLGLVPAGISFEFPLDDKVAAVYKNELSRQDIDGFVRVLQSMSADELRSVSLPAHLVVTLLSKR